MEAEGQPLSADDYETLDVLLESPKQDIETRFWRTRDSIRVAKHRSSSKKTLSVKKRALPRRKRTKQ
jgi:hypothetical protein